MAETPLWAAPRGDAALDVVGLGQGSLDHVADVEQLPRWAEKAPIAAYRRLPGGQIATACLACVRLGLRTAFVGSVGGDEAGDAIVAPLAAAGVELGGVRRIPDAPSQLALIVVDRASGERTVLWYRDPRLALRPAQLERSEIERGRALLLDAGDLEASCWAAAVARAAGRAVVLDADTPAAGIERLLASVDFPVVSQEFAERQFGGIAAALRALAQLGARLPVVTLGARGAMAWWRDEPLSSPGFRVVARDTTGAGDAFHGAFTAGLLRGLGPVALLRFANATAAMNCRALGAQGGLPMLAEVEGFLAEHP